MMIKLIDLMQIVIYVPHYVIKAKVRTVFKALVEFEYFDIHSRRTKKRVIEIEGKSISSHEDIILPASNNIEVNHLLQENSINHWNLSPKLIIKTEKLLNRSPAHLPPKNHSINHHHQHNNNNNNNNQQNNIQISSINSQSVTNDIQDQSKLSWESAWDQCYHIINQHEATETYQRFKSKLSRRQFEGCTFIPYTTKTAASLNHSHHSHASSTAHSSFLSSQSAPESQLSSDFPIDQFHSPSAPQSHNTFHSSSNVSNQNNTNIHQYYNNYYSNIESNINITSPNHDSQLNNNDNNSNNSNNSSNNSNDSNSNNSNNSDNDVSINSDKENSSEDFSEGNQSPKGSHFNQDNLQTLENNDPINFKSNKNINNINNNNNNNNNNNIVVEKSNLYDQDLLLKFVNDEKNTVKKVLYFQAICKALRKKYNFIYLPTYQKEFKYNKKTYKFLINAQNGAAHGTRPYGLKAIDDKLQYIGSWFKSEDIQPGFIKGDKLNEQDHCQYYSQHSYYIVFPPSKSYLLSYDIGWIRLKNKSNQGVHLRGHERSAPLRRSPVVILRANEARFFPFQGKWYFLYLT